jgi:MCP family monocarboxylic acid transporter-like MFS transporter 10
MCCISLVATSFVHSIEMTFVTFSLLYGLGSSLAYTATMTLVESYFSKYVTMATGITMAGSSIGTLVMNPLAQALVTSHGWRTTFQILAAASLLAMGCSWTFKSAKRRQTDTGNKEKKMKSVWRTFKDFRMCQNKRYVVWVIGLCFIMFGYYIPYVHLVSEFLDYFV